MNAVQRVRRLRRDFGVAATAAILNVDPQDVHDAINEGTEPPLGAVSFAISEDPPVLVEDTPFEIEQDALLVVNAILAVTAANGSAATLDVEIDGDVVATESIAAGDGNGGITTRKVSVTVPVSEGQEIELVSTEATGGAVTIQPTVAFLIQQ